MPLEGAVDVSLLSAMRVRRRLRERDAPQKLALLRRLAHPELARLTETRVEQSFNEQLFARVFDFRTLFSHGTDTFHLLPKNNAGRRYDDFSLGYFGQGDDRVLASAELKSPGLDLDAQVGGRSAVQQALSAAALFTGCRWAIVCNFTELRLYAVENGAQLVRARLDDVAGRDDLAALCAHFDREALLGRGRNEVPDVTIAMTPEHPAAPIEPIAGRCRLVCRFTPKEERTYPLHRVEVAVRDAVSAAKLFAREDARIALRDGWVSATVVARDFSARVALSRYGEVQLSAALPPGTSDISSINGRPVTPMNVWAVLRVMATFAGVVSKVCRSLRANDNFVVGQVDAELREVADHWLDAGDLARALAVACGIVTANDVVAGGVTWPAVQENGAAALAEILSELAIFFRGREGGVLLNAEHVASRLSELIAAR